MTDKKNRTYSLDEDTRELLDWFDENTTYNKSDVVGIAVKSLYKQHEEGTVIHQGLRGDLQVGDTDYPDVDSDSGSSGSSIVDRILGGEE